MGCVEISVGGPEDKRTLERDIYRWEDNIKINLEKPVWKVWTGFIYSQQGFALSSCDDSNYILTR